MALEAAEGEPRSLWHGAHLDAERREAVLGLEPGGSEDDLTGGDGAEPMVLLLGVPGLGEHTAAHDGAHEVGRGGECPSQLFVEGYAFDQRHPRASVLLGEEQADEVELAQLGPQLGRVARRVVLHGPDDVQGAVALQHVTQGLAEQLLLLIEFKVKHGALPL